MRDFKKMPQTAGVQPVPGIPDTARHVIRVSGDTVSLGGLVHDPAGNHGNHGVSPSGLRKAARQ